MSDTLLVFKEFMDSLTLTNDKPIMPRRDGYADYVTGELHHEFTGRKTCGEGRAEAEKN